MNRTSNVTAMLAGSLSVAAVLLSGCGLDATQLSSVLNSAIQTAQTGARGQSALAAGAASGTATPQGFTATGNAQGAAYGRGGAPMGQGAPNAAVGGRPQGGPNAPGGMGGRRGPSDADGTGSGMPQQMPGGRGMPGAAPQGQGGTAANTAAGN